MRMGCYSIVVVLFFLLIFMMCVQVDLAKDNNSSSNNYGNIRNYITQDDFYVDEQTLGFKFNNEIPVIIVDQHGNGHSRTVQGAVDLVPDNNTKRVKIYIYPGIYREKVVVPITKPYISFIGKMNGTTSPLITWNDKASNKGSDGQELGTYNSATVAVDSDYFFATDVTFENSVVAVPSGIGMQAVALRVSSERAMFYRVIIRGTQDTLLDDKGKHYFLDCFIEGEVDFIFGGAKSLYVGCTLHSTAQNYGTITAHRRYIPDEDSGFSFVRCAIRGTSGSVYLGRAWGDYATVVYSLCYMDGIINPKGWSEWDHPEREKTALYAEFACWGKGANRRQRVPWSKSFNYEEARPFMDISFINGDKWLRL